MVRREQLEELFEVKEGVLFGRYVSWRRKESNARVAGKPLGTPDKKGYLQVNFQTEDGQKHRMLVHRIIYFMSTGYLPSCVDHIDRNVSNNLPSNLREANKQLNALNTGPRINNKTGTKGVHYHKGKYDASFFLCKKKEYLGRFDKLEEAVEAVNARRNEEIERARAKGYISPIESCKETV